MASVEYNASIIGKFCYDNWQKLYTCTLCIGLWDLGESVAKILLNTYVRIGQSCKRYNKKEIADIYIYIILYAYTYVDKLILVC